jgi:hypothetical protein
VHLVAEIEGSTAAKTGMNGRHGLEDMGAVTLQRVLLLLEVPCQLADALKAWQPDVPSTDSGPLTTRILLQFVRQTSSFPCFTLPNRGKLELPTACCDAHQTPAHPIAA